VNLPKGEITMSEQTFENVWFLPDENRWSDKNFLAYKDKGKLIVRDDSLEFQGNQERVVITRIRRVSFGKQGRDFVNNWVKIEYSDDPTLPAVFFADGSSLGYGGIFGGTKRIFNSVQLIVKMNSATNSPSASAKKEANNTLKLLETTPPPVDPKLATNLSNKPGNSRMGAVAGSVTAFITIVLAQFMAIGGYWSVQLLCFAVFGAFIFGMPIGGIGGVTFGRIWNHPIAAIIGGITAVSIIAPCLLAIFSYCGFLGGC